MRGFGGGGMGGLMAQAQKMQAKLAKVQEEIAAMEIDGEAGNGAVKVTVSGKHECRRVHIDPAAVDPDDIEMLEAVGMPVAMGNAADEVKAIAKKITATNAEHGVARAIYDLLTG